MPRQLSDDQWEFLAARKRLQYEYAHPYLKPTLGHESEADLRARVREALMQLPLEDRIALRSEVAEERRRIFGPELDHE